MKTALITGACGFVGNALAHTLVNAGWQVHLLDLPEHPHWDARPEGPRAHRFSGDIRDRDLVSLAARGCSHIFHTAALLNSIKPRDVFFDINVNGTRNLCEIARENRVERLFHFATSDVFGVPEEDDQVFSEKSPYQPWNEPYADSKIEAALLVKKFIKEEHLPATIVYPGWVYGPGDRQFFPTVMQMVRDKWVFTWHRKHAYEIDLIHIDDLTRAVMLMIELPIAAGEDYLILDNQTKLPPEQFYRLMADVMQVPVRVIRVPYPLMMAIAWVSQTLTQQGITQKHLLSTTDVKAFGNSFHFKTDKARRELGWQPSIKATEGVRKAVEWQLQQNRPVMEVSSSI